MKVALVHELLTMRGGAERVLRVFAGMFPDAPVYTLLYDEAKLGEWFPKERVRTSRLQPWTALTTNHHAFLPFFPRAVEAWDFSEFDLVLSSSSAFAHGIITNGKPKHVSYIHSPSRYLWDRTHEVLARRSLPARIYGEHVFHTLRTWDAEAAARADSYVAVSKEVQRRISLYWDRESTVIHPPIDDRWLGEDTSHKTQDTGARAYFLLVSTLAPYKRIELAVDACTSLNLPLKIVGDGPARGMLEKRAGPTVEFLGYQSGDALPGLYGGARAVIFPGDEDFGLVPLEAMACGTPVIAFASGGALETVTEGVTGTFFHAPTADSLTGVLRTYDHKKYSIQKCKENALQYSRSTFEHRMRTHIEHIMSS